MSNNNELKNEFLKLMHEMIRKNKSIIGSGEYSNLISLCEQDITILSCIKVKEDITAKEISKLLFVPKTTIVTAVSRLEKRGYIIKVQNEKDKREMLLRLTEKGIRANDEHIEYENIIIDSFINMWNRSDREKVVALLKCRKELL